MHATGQAHSDVKPGNLLLMGTRERGEPDLRRVVVADFDLVLPAGEWLSHT